MKCISGVTMDSFQKWEKGFLVIESVLYAAFLLADLRQAYAVGTALKYLSILLCLWLVILRALQGGEWSMAAALALTAVADGLLLVSQRQYGLGIFIFLCVQGIYAVRIGRETPYTLIVRTGLVLIVWRILWRMGLATGVNLLAGLYFPQLVCNAVLALGLKERWGRQFALGLLLFVGCDVCVGLWNLSGWIPERVIQAAGFGMWVFYLPSQVCIALSTLKK